MGYIYLIRNMVNGKGYVGQTAGLVEQRFQEHIAASNRGCGFALYRGMRKYGVENFSISEVASCDDSLLNDLEKHYVKFYGTFSPVGHGYNMTIGGDGSLGYTMSDESKAKMSLAKKGKPMSEAGKQARRGKIAWNRGMKKPKPVRVKKARKPVSEETRAKMAAAKLGKTPWNKGKGKIVEKVVVIRSCSEETKVKIGNANRGRYKGVPWTQARRDAQIRRAS
jgi:group I intron endonuclease